MKELITQISTALQALQEKCIGTCKIAGTHSFILEHNLVTGYTITFQVHDVGGTSTDHFNYLPWDDELSPGENMIRQQNQPPITEWKLK